MLQSISEFLKDLPCHDEQNFALFNTENGIRTSLRRPSVYLPTVDIPSDQSKEKKNQNISPVNVLIRFHSTCSYSHRKEKHFTQILASTMGQKGKISSKYFARILVLVVLDCGR